MKSDSSEYWYHGSPCKLSLLEAGSTITQNTKLARIFSHKPVLVSISDRGQVKHNGTMKGYLYRVAEHVGSGDVTPHPRSTMAVGDEWITTRTLALELLEETEPVLGELLTEDEIKVMKKQLEQRREQGPL